LYHDNAPVNVSLLVSEFLSKNNAVVMPQLSYSLDMAPSAFFLFPKIKRTTAEHHFATPL
ncbi:hypothetical protein WH47_07048, partial [Habropoda laboriosa]